ncbi:MAG TPA: hypothetical protein VGB74_11940 [Actinoplanes sp.]|jgi:hypothetical protein
MISVAVLTAIGMALTPAPAAGKSEFELSVGGISAYGSYQMKQSTPEHPVPPIAVRGTLAVNSYSKCGVIQLAKNGPADGIEWSTVTHLCRRGKTNFRTTSSFLWGGGRPQLRLCTGATQLRAEQGRRCDVYAPPPYHGPVR